MRRPLLALALVALLAGSASASSAPLACKLGALNAREQGRHETLQAELMKRAQVEERPDGYALRFPGDAATYSKVVEFVGYERRCCPFLDFEVRAGATNEPLWLVLTGTPEVKAFLSETEFFSAKTK